MLRSAPNCPQSGTEVQKPDFPWRLFFLPLSTVSSPQFPHSVAQFPKKTLVPFLSLLRLICIGQVVPQWRFANGAAPSNLTESSETFVLNMGGKSQHNALQSF